MKSGENGCLLQWRRSIRKAHELEGQVSGEHGIGYAKKPYLRESLPEKNLDLMNGIKKVFDPKNILNPHKVAQR